jgi:hemoglobin
MDNTEQIDEEGLRRLVTTFYGRLRRDAELGPVFEEAVDDWPEHFEKLTAFWSSVMLATGRYQGNPMQAHARRRNRITPQMFDRWLALWNATTEEVMPPEAATALQERAARIGESLKLGLFLRLDPRPTAA